MYLGPPIIAISSSLDKHVLVCVAQIKNEVGDSSNGSVRLTKSTPLAPEMIVIIFLEHSHALLETPPVAHINHATYNIVLFHNQLV